jgi:glycosyl transferase-like sugar-binding protein
MRFLPDEYLYVRTEACLRFLRQVGTGPGVVAPGSTSERFHLYWHGPFARKQAFTVKSFLATQDLAGSRLWLWLDSEAGYADHAENPVLRPLLPFLEVRRFDPALETEDTPLAGRPDLHRDGDPVARSNLARFAVLYRFGGIYADMDTMFLRDLRPLLQDPRFTDEFCYRWSGHRPYGNSAILRLRARSETARALLVRCAEVGSCRPRHVLDFAANAHLDLLVLPCAFFDPLWLHHDRRDWYSAAPFTRWEDFFQRVPWRARIWPARRSLRGFFPGAFSYHWHNCWGAPEAEDSYFGLFDREFDRILRDRLGIQ